MSPHDQGCFDVRCEFGPRGLAQLAGEVDAVILVDVLSFTTAVSVAIDAGAEVLPYRFKDERAAAYAERFGAALAGARDSSARYSLSPPSLRGASAGERIVLPSPNGATLALEAPLGRSYAGCLRNASAVAENARRHGSRIAIVPAGERWEDGSLRPCIEDWLGAGAIASMLPGTRSPEAEAAIAAWEFALQRGLLGTLSGCASGRELSERGYAEDVRCAAELDASAHAPLLGTLTASPDGEEGRCFVRAERPVREAGSETLSEARPLRVLFLCSQNRLRSPTAEALFQEIDGISVASAGLHPNAKNVLTAEQLDWADLVFVMEDEHKRLLLRDYGHRVYDKRVVILGIPDRYDFMDGELVSLLKQRVTPHLEVADRVPAHRSR